MTVKSIQPLGVGGTNYLDDAGAYTVPPGGGGGGTAVTVNGGVAQATADLDSVIPAAPANGRNVVFQKDTSAPINVSAHILGDGVATHYLDGTGAFSTPAGGSAGPPGADGADGADGMAGPMGPAGSDGAPGARGFDGADGSDGDMGPPAAIGNMGNFVASGAAHAPGIVPDPGSVAGTAKFLREDATWATPTAIVSFSFDGGANPVLARYVLDVEITGDVNADMGGA